MGKLPALVFMSFRFSFYHLLLPERTELYFLEQMPLLKEPFTA